MQRILLFFFAIIFAVSTMPTDAEARYRYRAPGCDFRITFAEAPSVETIWPDDPLPFWDIDRGFGEVGEKASFIRNYPGQGHVSFVATCVKADEELVKSFDKDSMFITLEEMYTGYTIKNQEFNYSDDPERHVKWASVSGFYMDEQDQIQTVSGHFVLGPNSIMLLKSSMEGDDEYLTQEYNDTLYSIIAE